jgi:hypothetical protein
MSEFEKCPVALTSEQEKLADTWAADDGLWTMQETVAFNLRTFARAVILESTRHAQEPMSCGHPKACLETISIGVGESETYCNFCLQLKNVSDEACEHEKQAVEQAVHNEAMRITKALNYDISKAVAEAVASRNTEWALALTVLTEGLPVGFEAGNLSRAAQRCREAIKEQAVAGVLDSCAVEVGNSPTAEIALKRIRSLSSLSPDTHFLERKYLEARLDEAKWLFGAGGQLGYADFPQRIADLERQLAALKKPEGGGK